MPRLLLVDGHSNLYRAFYAIRTPLTAPDGTPTGAAYGFLRMLDKLLREIAPTHVAVAFDSGGETFRTRLDARYKAHRPPMPADLQVQIPLAVEALRRLELAVLQVEDVEADDVIGTLATRAAGEGFEVVIATTDKDLLQLVRDPAVRVWHTRLERPLDERSVEEVFGVPPAQVTAVLALMGDASDNVPGCPGIGEKGARELIRRWGSVASIYQHLAEVEPARARRALEAHREQVELSAELVRIRTDLELDTELEDLARREVPAEQVAPFYRRLGFTSLVADAAVVAETPPAAPMARQTVAPDRLAALLAGSDLKAVQLAPGLVIVATGTGVSEVMGEERALAAVLAPCLGGVWCHDAKALIARLRESGQIPAEHPNDVMLAGYLLAPGEAVDLASLARRETLPLPAPDDPGTAAATVYALAAPLSRRLDAEGLRRVYEEIERPLVPVLEAMERRGIMLDTAALADLAARLQGSLASLESEIATEAGGPFNLNSPSQLAEVLFTRRGLPVLRRTAKTRAPSTDAEVLAELAARGHRLPALLLEYREHSKLLSTYVDALPKQLGRDGRLHTRFNQAVTATGRLSSSDPNLQNIPVRTGLGREVRRAFVAAPGCRLLTADYSQIELRVLADMADEKALEAAFARGDDIHRATAALVFGVSEDLVSAEMRRAAKTINFGLIYGMSAFALARELGVSNAEAQGFVTAYFERMPRVREFMEETKRTARHEGKVRTLVGRVRWIAGLDSRNAQLRGNAERMAMNAPIQGTAADIMKLAMIRLAARLAAAPDHGALILQVHDEVVLEVPEPAVPEVTAIVREALQGVEMLRVPLEVGIGVGSSWAAAKG